MWAARYADYCMQIAANFRNFGKNRNYGNTIVKNGNFRHFRSCVQSWTRNLPIEIWYDNAVSNTIMMSCKLTTLLAGTFWSVFEPLTACPHKFSNKFSCWNEKLAGVRFDNTAVVSSACRRRLALFLPILIPSISGFSRMEIARATKETGRKGVSLSHVPF